MASSIREALKKTSVTAKANLFGKMDVNTMVAGSVENSMEQPGTQILKVSVVKVFGLMASAHNGSTRMVIE